MSSYRPADSSPDVYQWSFQRWCFERALVRSISAADSSRRSLATRRFIASKSLRTWSGSNLVQIDQLEHVVPALFTEAQEKGVWLPWPRPAKREKVKERVQTWGESEASNTQLRHWSPILLRKQCWRNRLPDITHVRSINLWKVLVRFGAFVCACRIYSIVSRAKWC